ncbi:MAG: 7-carboxy-7-deazaguanine synthase QueE [Deltaproteobacteria bacterium]|nr:7-carboxy-7-deazaguanine synthase QueE [Deltaproteobacteria bacterium]
MKHEARLIEIFSSIQGEGTMMGEPMTFVRFEQCSFGCRYCDTPESFRKHKQFRVENPPKSKTFLPLPNPVSAPNLNELLLTFNDPTISITGGEPLEQAEFLSTWLPMQFGKRKIFLETNGVHVEGLKSVLPYLNIISMDLKPPTSTGTNKVYWKEHAEFLQLCVANQKEIYVKIVVTPKLSDRDIEECIRLVSQVSRYVPLILQPVSQTLTYHDAVDNNRVRSIERTCKAYLPDVRVIPQMHKIWNVL